MPRMLSVSCGTCRHPQFVPVRDVAELDAVTTMPEFVVLTLKPKRWIRDTFGDGQWR